MDSKSLQFKSQSVEETTALGEEIGELVESGQIILLSGQLGSGKTVLVQGIARGLQIEEPVTSPTYNLINEYDGQLPIYHMDLYRLDDEIDLYQIGFEEYLDKDGVIIIEWPDLAYDFIPSEFIYIKIKRDAEENRLMEIDAEGESSNKLLEGLAQYVNPRS